MPKYIVGVDVYVEKRYTIEAEDEVSAMDAAEGEAEDDCGWNTHQAWVRDSRILGYEGDGDE